MIAAVEQRKMAEAGWPEAVQPVMEQLEKQEERNLVAERRRRAGAKTEASF